MKRYLITGILLAAVLAGTVLIVKKIRPLPTAILLQPAVDFRTKGPSSAPVEMVEFSDFQCPACQKAVGIVKNLISFYPGEIHFVFRHFPLPGHRWSLWAHQAAECAGEQKKFWEYHDKLYEGQALWSNVPDVSPILLEYARQLNLNLDSFAACFASRQINQRILQDKQMGDKLHVESTPTFFINGERIVGPFDLEIKGNEVIREKLGLPKSPVASPASPAMTLPASASPVSKHS